MEKGRVFVAILLLVAGGVLLAGNLLPGWAKVVSWPFIFFVLALGFFLPAALWSEHRRGLAGMLIPGAIMLGLGLIFTYNLVSGDWGAWAYLWALIPASVGLGLMLAAWVGGWGNGTAWVGIIMTAVSLGVFALMATLLGGEALSIIGPILLILLGVALVLRSNKRSTSDA